jgi:hypothetical protein
MSPLLINKGIVGKPWSAVVAAFGLRQNFDININCVMAVVAVVKAPFTKKAQDCGIMPSRRLF